MSDNNVMYLVNYHYGKLRIAVNEDELEKIKLSSDGWEVIDKEKYYQLKTMYDAGKRDIIQKVNDSLR